MTFLILPVSMSPEDRKLKKKKKKQNYIQIKQIVKAKSMDYKKAQWVILAKAIQKI